MATVRKSERSRITKSVEKEYTITLSEKEARAIKCALSAYSRHGECYSIVSRSIYRAFSQVSLKSR